MDNKLFEELKSSEWYQSRPQIIKDAIELLPPTQLYQFKDSKKQCFIFSYEEPKSGKLEDVTVTVEKIGVGGPMAAMGLGSLDTNRVFGIKMDSLEPVLEN